MNTLSASPSLPAPAVRTAGAVFVLLLVLGPVCLMVVPSHTVVAGDAAATVTRLAAEGGLMRLGLLGEAVIALAELFMIVALWVLFRPVHGPVALVAAGARGAMVVLQGAALACGLAALSWAEGRGLLGALPKDELARAVAVVLELRTQVGLVWQLFFGLHCLLLGFLIARAGFVPRVLGALMAVAGLGYLLAGLGPWLVPGAQAVTDVVVGLCAFLGETPFFVWLIAKGIDVPRGDRRRAEAAAAR